MFVSAQYALGPINYFYGGACEVEHGTSGAPFQKFWLKFPSLNFEWSVEYWNSTSGP